MWETWVRSLGQEDPLEKEMATHSSTLAWKISWTEEPGRLQSMGLQRVGHKWATSLRFFKQLMDVNYYTILLVRDSKNQSGDIVRVIAQKEIKLQEENEVSMYGLFLLCWVFIVVWAFSHEIAVKLLARDVVLFEGMPSVDSVVVYWLSCSSACPS